MASHTKTIIGVVVIVIALFVLWIFFGTSGIGPANAEQFDSENGIPPLILDNFRRWDLIASSLRILQVVLGVIGTAAALLVTTFTTELGTFRTKLLTFVAALCLGTLTAFDIGGKANQTRNAWRDLAVALFKYQHPKPSSDQSSYHSFDDLIAAYKHADEVVGDVAFRQQDQPTQATSKSKTNGDSETIAAKNVAK